MLPGLLPSLRKVAAALLAAASCCLVQAKPPVAEFHEGWFDPIDHADARLARVRLAAIFSRASSLSSTELPSDKGVVLMPGDTPTHLRWLVVRCAFAGGVDFAQSADTLQQQFEHANKGVFAFFERQSGGLLRQELLAVRQTALPRTWYGYWYDQPSQNLPGFLTDTTNDCLGPHLAAEPALRDASAVAVFYNEQIDGSAIGALTWLPVLGPELRPMMFIPSTYTPLMLAHELGHALRLPHTNNSDGDADTYDNAWDVMSNGSVRNAVLDPELGLLPRGLHPYHAYVLGWVAPDDVVDVDLNAGDDRTETFDLAPRRMVRVRLDGTRSVVVTYRPAGHADEGRRTEAAVFLDDLDTDRREPLWAVDTAVPAPTFTATDSSYFTAGERYTWDPTHALRALTLDVVSVSNSGARVRLHLGPPPLPDGIFVNGFDASDPFP